MPRPDEIPLRTALKSVFQGVDGIGVNFRRFQTRAPISLTGSSSCREIVDTPNFDRPKHFSPMMFLLLAILI
jgi:hypothetical protein